MEECECGMENAPVRIGKNDVEWLKAVGEENHPKKHRLKIIQKLEEGQVLSGTKNWKIEGKKMRGYKERIWKREGLASRQQLHGAESTVASYGTENKRC